MYSTPYFIEDTSSKVVCHHAEPIWGSLELQVGGASVMRDYTTQSAVPESGIAREDLQSALVSG